MVFVLFLALGLIQTALVLYARNVVMSSAHEAARAAIEVGQTPEEASVVARSMVRDSAGSLVEDLEVDLSIEELPVGRLLELRVSAYLRPIGPLPVEIPVMASATASKERLP